jgi:hypothetical protein
MNTYTILYIILYFILFYIHNYILYIKYSDQMYTPDYWSMIVRMTGGDNTNKLT